MKTGRPIEAIARQVLEESKAKKDYIAPTTALAMTVTDPAEGAKTPDVGLRFTVGGQARLYRPTPLCLGQICDHVGIPAKYAERMRAEAPGLLAQNVNHWFQAKGNKRMLRTMNHDRNIARAFLSDRYRPLDNADLIGLVVPRIIEAGCEIHSAEFTESRLYIQASTPKIQAIIDQNVVIGTHNRIQRTVQAGVIIGNSEVGCGSIFVEPIMYDLVCTNGLILQRTLKRHHVGRRNEGTVFGDEDTAELFSDETRRLDDKAFWAKVNDVVTASLDETKFNDNVLRLQETQRQQLCDKPTEVTEVVEVTTERLGLSEDEKGTLLLHFAQGGDFSKYGLINAITRTAADVESYDRAVELERMGGEVIELPPSDFRSN